MKKNNKNNVKFRLGIPLVTPVVTSNFAFLRYSDAGYENKAAAFGIFKVDISVNPDAEDAQDFYASLNALIDKAEEEVLNHENISENDKKVLRKLPIYSSEETKYDPEATLDSSKVKTGKHIFKLKTSSFRLAGKGATESSVEREESGIVKVKSTGKILSIPIVNSEGVIMKDWDKPIGNGSLIKASIFAFPYYNPPKEREGIKPILGLSYILNQVQLLKLEEYATPFGTGFKDESKLFASVSKEEDEKIEEETSDF